MNIIESTRDTLSDLGFAVKDAALEVFNAVRLVARFAYNALDVISNGNPGLAIFATMVVAAVGYSIFELLYSITSLPPLHGVQP